MLRENRSTTRPIPWWRGLLLLVVVLTLPGCASSSFSAKEADLWAGEEITNVDDAKRVTTQILHELMAMAPQELLMPAESQPPRSDQMLKHLVACNRNRNSFAYPGGGSYLFIDGPSAVAYEQQLNDFMRTQRGWHEKSTPDVNGGQRPMFVSQNGFSIIVGYAEYQEEHIVSISLQSPCFVMPDDFQQSVDTF